MLIFASKIRPAYAYDAGINIRAIISARMFTHALVRRFKRANQQRIQVQGKIYGFLTKREVKMAGYWPSSFFACLWTEKKSTHPK